MQISGQHSDFNITIDADGIASVSGSSIGTDTLRNIEIVSFSDGVVRIDIGGNAGQVYRVYKAAFNRTPDNDGLEFWINSVDSGTSIQDVAGGFVASQEFQSVYGANPTNEQIIDRFYQNVLGREGEAGGVAFWTGELNIGSRSVTDVLAGFSESAENIASVAPLIADGIFIT